MDYSKIGIDPTLFDSACDILRKETTSSFLQMCIYKSSMKRSAFPLDWEIRRGPTDGEQRGKPEGTPWVLQRL